MLRHLDDEYDLLCTEDLHTLEACWKWHVGLLGQQVIAETHDGLLRGRLLEMSFQGVEVEQVDGGRVVLEPEKVLHIGPAKEENE